jgi:hypothetical protein
LKTKQQRSFERKHKEDNSLNQKAVKDGQSETQKKESGSTAPFPETGREVREGKNKSIEEMRR